MMLYCNSRKGKEESSLLRIGLSPLSLLVQNHYSPSSKRKSLQSMATSCNIRSVLGLLIACCCQSLPFFQRNVKYLNVHKLGL